MEKIKNFFLKKKAAVAAMAFALCLLASNAVNVFASEPGGSAASTVDWANAASTLASDLVTMLNSLVPALVPIFATFIGIRVFLKLARRFTK